DAYLNEENIPVFNSFDLVESIECISQSDLNKVDLDNLIKMTPYFYKTSKENLDKVNNVNTLNITFAFNIYIYKKRTNY
ncbi:MAG: hypothetical protein J6T34_04575, partial [Bacilli bacterium]|nr:hypothetical protein [Bacilli bacterium]